jgi:predicted DNA-binding ribbon-helix-helix protein
MDGFVTSIRLENEYWKILDEMARGEGQSTPQFVVRLRNELLENHGEVSNFTSFLRVACSVYLTRGGRAGAMTLPVPAGPMAAAL